MSNDLSNLLLKTPDFQYDPEDIFKNDALNRQIVIENLSNLIWSANQSFVISIESPWGTGKTVFVNLWKQYLEKEKTPCVYFNAWENDFVSDPIIPFISTLDEYLSVEQKINKNSKIGKDIKHAKQIGSIIAKRSIPVILKIASQGVINLDSEELKEIFNDKSENEISGLIADISKDLIDEYSKKKNSIVELRKKIEEIAKDFVTERDKKPPLVIFIDELDRCRPDFAIMVLERLKHIFSVDGVVFVLTVDRSQLENSIKASYGHDIDVSGFLLKFVDYRFILPVPENSSSVFHSMMNKFDLFNFIKQKNPYNQNDETNNIKDYFLILSKFFNLSIREQEKFFTEFNLFIRLLPPNQKLFGGLVVFFIITKNKYELFFEEIFSGEISILKFEEFFDNKILSLKTDDEKFKLGFLQGELFKIISQNKGSEVLNSIPKEYINEIDDDSYKKGKFLGFKRYENRIPILPFIYGYFKIIKLLDKIQ